MTSHILAILTTEQPRPTVRQIVDRLQCSRQLVHETAKAAGITLPRGPWPRRTPADVIRRQTERFPGVRLTSPNTGAAAELLVCADLMYRGWHVYRCVSPHAPADLIATKGESMVRVEVRAGTRHARSGRLIYGQPTGRLFDVLAIVDLEQKVEYRGPMASALNA